MSAPVTTFPRWVDRDANLRQVDVDLYVGGLAAIILLPRASIGAWVDLAQASAPRALGPATEAATAHMVPGAVLRLNVPDGGPLPADALWGAASVVAAHRPVLVSCAAGASRSASVAYAILRVRGHSHDEALRRVSSPCGPDPDGATLASARAWAEGLL
mgnify:CR=1 FL=1